MTFRFFALGLPLVWMVGCGGSPSGPPQYPDDEEPEEAADSSWKTGDEHASDEKEPAPKAKAAAPEPEIKGMPKECASKEGTCTPPNGWVKKLCENVNADVALYLFRQGTPWQRLYLRGKTEAVNASGGASVAGYLEFDEEVLVLRHRPTDKDGIQVGSGNGSYDALRWNGSCVSLEGEEVTTDRAPRPKHSRVEWRWLSDTMREALRENAKISDAYLARQKECKGATMGAVTKKCETLDNKLVDLIVEYVRGGGEIPEPGTL